MGQKIKREDGRMACQLDNLEEGCVGKLQIRASGACQLVLGDQVMSVEVGTKVGFLQDAVSVQLPKEQGGVGDMTVLAREAQAGCHPQLGLPDGEGRAVSNFGLMSLY